MAPPGAPRHGRDLWLGAVRFAKRWSRQTVTVQGGPATPRRLRGNRHRGADVVSVAPISTVPMTQFAKQGNIRASVPTA